MPEGPRPAGETETNFDLARRLVPGTLVAGRYRIVKPLGMGGMGVVYLARDEELASDVAVKVLRPDLGKEPLWLERFRRELLLAREVTHKNVVRIHDIGESDGLRFLTMRYVEGRSLRELLEEQKRLPLERVVKIGRQLAEALQQAHAAGVVHRDLKPGNILVEADDTAYVSDFGVARSLLREGMTTTGVVVGTPDYLSPEQIAGEAVDARSDLYAMGILLFEMLTGELPFSGASRSELLAQRLTGHSRELADTGVRAPRWIQEVIRRCLQRSPERRYQDALALLADLDRQAVTRARAARPRLLVALAAGLVVVALAWSLFARRDLAAPPPAAAPSTPVVAREGIAVLPLADETADKDLAWSGTGLAEILAARLSDSPTLRVLDAMRVFRTLRDLQLTGGRYDDAALKRIAELLEVDRLVAGSVRRAGAALRVDLRLVTLTPDGAANLRHLDAESPDAGGLFRLADALAADLRRELGAPAAPAADPETTSLDAARAYREGLDRLALDDAAGAAAAFERALASDTGFAAALERLSQAYQSLGYQEKALAVAERAAAKLGGSETRLGYRARARLSLLKGDPAAAEKSYAELLRRYPNDAEALLDLAGAQAGEGESAKAVETLKQAALVDPGDPRVFFLLGKNMIQAGEARKAVGDPLLRALSLQTQLGNEHGQGEVLNAMGVAFHELGEYPQAREKYTAAAVIREKLGDQRGLATSLKNRARVLVAMGRFAEGEPDLKRARSLYEKIGDPPGVADVLDDLGVLDEGRGDFDAARQAYQEALKLRRSLGDEQALAQSYDNVGYIFFLQGEYDNALVYWQQALERRQRIGDKGGIVLSTQNLGFLQLAQGKWDQALKSFVSALDLSREIDFKNAMAVSYGNIGLLQHYEGRSPAALKSLEQALALLRELDDKRGLAEFTLKQAGVLLDLGRLDAAQAKLDAVAPWLEATGNREQSSDQAVLEGELKLRRGEPAEAQKALLRAQELADSSHSRAAILRARVAQASQLLASGDAAAAAASFARLVKDADALGEILLRIHSLAGLARAELARGRTREAEDAARRALRLAEGCGYEARLYQVQGLLGAILERKGELAEAGRQYGLASERLAKLREGLDADARRDLDALPEAQQVAAWSAAHKQAAGR